VIGRLIAHPMLLDRIESAPPPWVVLSDPLRAAEPGDQSCPMASMIRCRSST